MSEGGSGTRGPRSGPFLIQIAGLPHGYTWQDLKDLVRPMASHGIWTDISLNVQGTRSVQVGRIRFRLWREASDAYKSLCREDIQERRLYVELWDITASCTPFRMAYNHEPSSAVMQSSPREVERLSQDNTWVQVAPRSLPQSRGPYITQAYSPSAQRPLMQPVPADLMTPPPTPQQVSPEQLALYFAQLQTSTRQAAIQQPTSQHQSWATSSSGLPVNTTNGVAVVESRAVFVQGLPYKAKESDVERIFGQVGTVISCKIQKDSHQKSKGCATVVYGSAQDASCAVQRLNNCKVQGRDIKVRIDKDATHVGPPPTRPSGTDRQPVIVNGSSGHRSRSSRER